METNKQVDFDFVKQSWLVELSFTKVIEHHSLAKNKEIINFE